MSAEPADTVVRRPHLLLLFPWHAVPDLPELAGEATRIVRIKAGDPPLDAEDPNLLVSDGEAEDPNLLVQFQVVRLPCLIRNDGSPNQYFVSTIIESPSSAEVTPESCISAYNRFDLYEGGRFGCIFIHR